MQEITPVDLAQLPIRFVCATKLHPNQFLVESLTGRSAKALYLSSKVEIRLFPENAIGLSELYNQAIEEAAEKPAILVFIHDDILICDYFWAKRVRDGLLDFDVVGLAGNKRRVKNQPGWRTVDVNGNNDDQENLSGAVGQGWGFPPATLNVFGATNVECKLLDGLFLAVDSRVLHKSGLRFDSLFTFHFYDMDFCRSAEQLNLRMGTIDLSVVHASYGSMDNFWLSAYKNYIAKWKE